MRPVLAAVFRGFICVTVLFIAITAFVFSTPSFAGEWDACKKVFSQKRPINELPMYGFREKTAAQKNADNKFIKKAYEIGTREKAVRDANRSGWKFLNKKDMKAAIKRFNQAWLLDQTNGDAYWGFATIVSDRDRDLACTEVLFEKAADILPNNIGLEIDLALFQGRRGDHAKSVRLLLKVAEKHPNAQGLHRFISMEYFRLNDLRKSLHHATIARNQGDKNVPAKLIKMLTCGVKMMDEGKSEAEISVACAP